MDTYFLSKVFDRTDYVEQNAELCRIAEHNFSLQHSAISIHNFSAEEFLQTAGQYDLIFLDPARRDSHGGKVFRLEDCTPNVVELLPTLLAHGKQLMIKLSPPCADACHEGAITMVDGKARLMRDDYCDGLGDCLPA